VSAVEGLIFPSFGDEEIAALFEPLKTLPALAVGVSGGPDSMALLLLLAAWRARLGELAPEIHVLSVDHGLRAEAKDEVEMVAGICRQYGLPHKTFSWTGAKPEGNISAQAREARYDLMTEWCVSQQISHLLVAHSLDDQAETVLLRLARGSGVDGLSAMAVSRKWNTTTIYRPLLGVKRSALVQLVKSVPVAFVDDASNHDLKYDRVRFRRAMEILEPLGITSEGLAETAVRLAQARAALDTGCAQALGQAVAVYDAGYCIVYPRQLQSYPYEIKRRVLGRLLCAVAGRPYAPPHASLDSLLDWLGAPSRANRTLGGCLLMPRGDEIWMMRESGRNLLPELLLQPGQSSLWDRRMKVSLSAAAEVPLMVKALGVDTYARIKPAQKTKMPYPSLLAAALPSFWCGQELIAVPHLNFGKAELLCQIEAGFANSAQLTAG